MIRCSLHFYGRGFLVSAELHPAAAFALTGEIDLAVLQFVLGTNLGRAVGGIVDGKKPRRSLIGGRNENVMRELGITAIADNDRHRHPLLYVGGYVVHRLI